MLASQLRGIGVPGGGGDFNPLDLSPLVFYDPADITTLWQDSSAANPVTSTSQTVLKMNDISGNGFHAGSSTGPVYAPDGLLEFNGSDQFLQATIPNFAYPYLILCVSERWASNDPSGVVTLSNTTTYANSVGVGFSNLNTARAWVYETGGSFNGSETVNSDTRCVLSGTYETGGSYVTVNGLDSGPTVTGVVNGANNLGLSILNRGVLADGYYGGKLGGILVFDYNIGAENYNLCVQWLADRYGVTL